MGQTCCDNKDLDKGEFETEKNHAALTIQTQWKHKQKKVNAQRS